MSSPRSKSWLAAAAAAATVCAGLPLLAQSQDGSTSAREAYRQDVADCRAGHTTQSRADCMYEARSALRDRLNGDPDLSDANDAQVARAADGMGGTRVAGYSGSMTRSDTGSTGTSSTSSDGSTTSDTSGASSSNLAPRADRN